MATATADMYTAGKIAEQLSAPPAKVKKAIEELKIKPVAKKGVCSYYGKDAIAKIKTALK